MMNANDINIDFLLGLGSTAKVAGPTGGSEALENGGPLFGEMLNEMLMSYPGAVNRPILDVNSENPSQFSKQFELPSNVEAGPDGELGAQSIKGARPFVLPNQLVGMQQTATLDSSPASTDQQAISNAPTADGVSNVVDENVGAFNRELRSQLPTHALPMHNTAIKLNLAVPTNLEAGSYEVIESHQTDGTVTLKLADPSTADGFIKVQLPVERLSSEALRSSREQSDQAAAVKRVDLDAVPKQNTSIERLFAQLNLKQIEVSNVAVDNDSTHDNLSIKLSGVKKDGVDVQLKAELPEDQLKAFKVEPQLSSAAKTAGHKQMPAVSARANNNTNLQNPSAVQSALANSDSLDEQTLASRRDSAAELNNVVSKEATETSQTDRARANATQLFAPVPAPKIRNAGSLRSRRVDTADAARSSGSPATTENDQLLTTFSQSLKQSQAATSKLVNNVIRQTKSEFDLSTLGGDSESADPFANLDSVRETGKSLTGKLTQREVRFSLPDDLASKLKPNGQSVMIRINPDHLGPARLSLRMYGDKLSARIIVETAGIKSVVEQSLDRLTQQLTKSGIDVERIEVALDNRQSGEQMSERHPHWQRQARSAHLDENILTETNEDSPITPAPASAPAVVGTGGVNVLA